MLLKGKKALVTGGSRGIGKAIVCRFLEEGADVWFISTKESPFVAEMREKADANSCRLCWKQGNVADETAITQTVADILTEAENIDILVNNAGVTRDGLSFRMSSEAWQEVIQVNLSSAFYVTRPIVRKMVSRKAGSIINLSSIVGLVGNPGQVNYAASKAGLIGFTKSLAKETASRRVRVNALAPGFIDSDMTAKLPEKAKSALLDQVPCGRLGQAAEVADSAVFLASDMASYITGHVLQVDGGLAM